MLIGILLLLVTMQLPPEPHHDGTIMQLPVYEPEPRYQIVLEGSEDHYLRGSHDDTDSPSMPNVEECKEEMRIFGNLACSQDSDSEDTDAFLTPLNSSLNHLILHSRLSEETSHIYINWTETELSELC